MTGPGRSRTTQPVTDADLYDLPEGTVLWKPQFSGWTLFIKDAGWWRVVDSYARDRRGERYTSAAVGTHSPGYVIHQPPDLGYYEPPPDHEQVSR